MQLSECLPIEHNFSGDEKSSDHAKPRQNRRVQFSYYRHQSLPGATGTIFRCKQRSRRLCRVTQMKSNPNFFYWRQGLRCSFGSLLTDSSFWENVCTAHHYPKESFRTEETRYRREIPILQSYTTRRRVSQRSLLTWNIWLQLASSTLTWMKPYAIVSSVVFAVRRHKRNC